MVLGNDRNLFQDNHRPLAREHKVVLQSWQNTDSIITGLYNSVYMGGGGGGGSYWVSVVALDCLYEATGDIITVKSQAC